MHYVQKPKKYSSTFDGTSVVHLWGAFTEILNSDPKYFQIYYRIWTKDLAAYRKILKNVRRIITDGHPIIKGWFKKHLNYFQNKKLKTQDKLFFKSYIINLFYFGFYSMLIFENSDGWNPDFYYKNKKTQISILPTYALENDYNTYELFKKNDFLFTLHPNETLLILNGANKKYFKKFKRIKRVTGYSIDEKKVITFTLRDIAGWQKLKLPSSIRQSVYLYISGTYPGEKKESKVAVTEMFTHKILLFYPQYYTEILPLLRIK